jgi:amino acid adenylation domain-containing protein
VKENILAYRLQKAFKKYSANPALRVDGITYTYAELYASAISIAHYIQKEYTDHNGPMAVPGGKGFHTFAGICGILLSSRAYMPLNRKFPEARNNSMIELSGAKVLDTDIAIGDDIHEEIEINAQEEDTAYLLFTSGTTGTPKGVPVSNSNVCAYLDHVLDEWDFREDDKFSQTFDLTFDLSVHDMFVCWLSGACLCIPDDDSAFKLAKYIKEQQISVWFSVPSAAMLMNKMRLLKTSSLESIRLSFFCGEPLPAEIADAWQAATGGSRLINLYGPSEATISITAFSWDEKNRKEMKGIASLGKIFSKQDFLLLDTDKMKRHPDRGELCLGGSQVIKAYLNNPELSANYFIQLDEEEGIWYRTGDLACLDEEGDLFFLGRTDTEVKISGYRVNLMEIEAVVRDAGAREVAAVTDEKDTPGIVCWISGEPKADEQSLLEACRRELPWYMIPERIIFVEEMPLNVNGKTDRNKLKQMLHAQE